jgi:hypothetical protein
MTSIWQVHTWSQASLNCVFITFESRITCGLHVLCMLAYSNIRKSSQSMKNWWWHYSYVPVIYLHIPPYTVIWRYMTVYVGISCCQDSRGYYFYVFVLTCTTTYSVCTGTNIFEGFRPGCQDSSLMLCPSANWGLHRMEILSTISLIITVS